MLNSAFDPLLELGKRLRLPITVSCHRDADAPLFEPNPRLDKRLRGFGWSDAVADRCTGLRHFRTPDGLDAVLFYQLPEGSEGCPSRQVTLLTFACGQLIDRLALVGWQMTNFVEREELELFATTTSTIAVDGTIACHHRSNWTRTLEEKELRYVLLPGGRIWRRLAATRVKVRKRTYGFSPAERAQVEAWVNRADRDNGLRTVLAAAQNKYHSDGPPVQRLVAQSLGIAPAEVKSAIEWWEGYVRMKDGPPPE